MNKILICGAGGFIGGHLVSHFLKQGHKNIRAVDIKPLNQWYQKFDSVENLQLDLEKEDNCAVAANDAKIIYNLSANMGGMGFIGQACQCHHGSLQLFGSPDILLQQDKFGLLIHFQIALSIGCGPIQPGLR